MRTFDVTHTKVADSSDRVPPRLRNLARKKGPEERMLRSLS